MRDLRKPCFVMLTLLAVLLGACRKQSDASTATVGDSILELSIWTGGTWGEAQSVDIKPAQYVVHESAQCPKTGNSSDAQLVPRFCVYPISKAQSDRVEVAMAPFRKAAIPLSDFSMEQEPKRPDGKPCKSRPTDGRLISFIWTRANGSEIATFDANCDTGEFRAFYDQAFAVSKLIPGPDQLPTH